MARQRLAYHQNHKKWLSALRSGEYKQTKGVLHRIKRPENGAGLSVEDQKAFSIDYQPGYCCLGVLCSVAGYQEEVTPDDPDRNRFYDPAGTAMTAVLSVPALSELFGVENEEDLVDSNSRPIVPRLMHYNDTGRTFEEIADYIEEEV